MNLEYLRSDRVARQKPVNSQNVGHMASETRAMRRTAFHLLVSLGLSRTIKPSPFADSCSG